MRGLMRVYPVSSTVNSVKNDGPECAEEEEVVEDSPPQRSLFQAGGTPPSHTVSFSLLASGPKLVLMYRKNKSSFQPYCQMSCPWVQTGTHNQSVGSLAISIKTKGPHRFGQEGYGDFSPGRGRRGSGAVDGSCMLGYCFYTAPAKEDVQGIRPTQCIRCPWLSLKGL